MVGSKNLLTEKGSAVLQKPTWPLLALTMPMTVFLEVSRPIAYRHVKIMKILSNIIGPKKGVRQVSSVSIKEAK
jgi:hypothetical protein